MWTLLPEWLDANTHRQFPLTDASSGVDSTGYFTLPQSLLADVVLNAPSWVDKTYFYVSKVVILKYTIDVEVSYYRQSGADVVAGGFGGISINQAPNSEHDFIPADTIIEGLGEFRDMTGRLIVGRTEEAAALPGEWAFPVNNARIMSTCVNTGLQGVRQILVDDVVGKGRVRLIEGDDVTIESEYKADLDETWITISASNLPESAVSIQNDADIISALVDQYGRPITAINNIPPDETGNFNLVPIDCTEMDVSAGVIQISNPCASPCCDPESYMQGAYEALDELNARCGRLTEFYANIRNIINEIQNELVRMQITVAQE